MTHRIASLALEGVTKVFGTVRAVAGLSFEVSAGEVVAVMGPNGAGKSTLLSLLSCNARPTTGRLLFNGEPVKSSDPAQRRKIGFLSHHPLVYPDLTAIENLAFFARLYGRSKPDRVAAEMAKRLGLEGAVTHRAARVLSRGQLQRLSLARALIPEPQLLLLDEPAAGLDSRAVAQICQILSDHAQTGGMAVMVTHEPEVAASTATRAILLKRGKIVGDHPSPGTADQWRALYTNTVEGSGP